MATRRLKDQQYSSKWYSFVNFLHNNTGYPIAGVARAGSRINGTYEDDSDLDIRFAIGGDPPRTTVYPHLKGLLENAFPSASVGIGGSYNIINVQIQDLNFDLVLLSLADFQDQVRNNRLERI
jgi:predicted nucleotidyltransferase